MSNVIENVVSDYIGKSESDFPNDTVSMAKELDRSLDELKDDYDRLKSRIKNDSLLIKKVEDLTKNATEHIVKHY